MSVAAPGGLSGGKSRMYLCSCILCAGPCWLVRAAEQGCAWQEVALGGHPWEGQKFLSFEEVCALPHTIGSTGTSLSSDPWLCLGLLESSSQLLCEA